MRPTRLFMSVISLIFPFGALATQLLEIGKPARACQRAFKDHRLWVRTSTDPANQCQRVTTTTVSFFTQRF